ncbi:capsular polysaccharide synthesis protein [Acetobacter cerevisiae]|uniref:Alpha 1,4-glycosyltransferase domain-containing protein n=1 Tax=Acetobacter cerevisiae TaxID=178900 RepID=A0A149R016_9PROT|nr:capsular polysaccharide synthesis protein [Acetobacter cerevisiae]KXV02841.1 hypothetical protein AD928_00565 [Acetobacter cerevisiae]GBQ08889.1 hypothetical protein AA14362_2084 [Acetobacter cerevisiae DSM 14362]
MLFQTFYEGNLGPQELACLTSFVKNGHEVVVYSYSYKHLPSFINGRDAREILPEEMLFSLENGDHKGSFAIFSDIFRWELLKKKGGIWIDTDVICISRDWPDTEIFFGYQDNVIINNAIMKFPKDHELLHEASRISQDIGKYCLWGETGPLLLTKLVEKYHLEKYSQVEKVFYPAQFWWAFNVREEEVSADKITEFRQMGAVCIHLWNECLRSADIDKNILPRDGSLLDYILDEYNLKGFYKEYKLKKDIKNLL